MTSGSETSSDLLDLIPRARIWAQDRAKPRGTTSVTPILVDALIGFYCSVGQTRLGRSKVVAMDGLATDLLAIIVREAQDAAVVTKDGDVEPSSLLYALIDQFVTWTESDDEEVRGLGERSRQAWNALLALPNPSYELGLPPPVAGAEPRSDSRPVPRSQGPSGASLAELLDELDSLVGLTEVKQQIRAEIDGQRANAERGRRGLPTVKPNLHMVFSGNPGTGKTTVARIVAEIYHHAGILSSGHLVEVGPGDMMGRFQGENTQRTQDIIEAAVGGVLLIDEAYTLGGTDRGPMEFQQQVIDTLVKGMEDHRRSLVVILTGYSQPMERFIRANAGLESRIGEWVEFPDYTTDELMQILSELVIDHKMQIEDGGLDEIRSALTQLERTERFGNARLMRNVFEDLVRELNMRIADEPLSTLDTARLNGISLLDARAVIEEIVAGRASERRLLRIGFIG